jgi:hypothetical protein
MLGGGNMRIALLICAVLAGCGQRELPATPVVEAFSQPPIRAVAPPPAAPVVCLEDARAALEARLVRDGRWADDPVVGAMSARGLNYGIQTHSYSSLEQGLRRYNSLRDGMESYDGGRTAALVTYAGDGESCSWLISGEGIAAYGRSSIGLDQVRSDVAAVISSLNVEGARAARSPRLRGAANTPAPAVNEPIAEPEAGPLATALAHVAETVLPAEVAAALGNFDSVIVAPHEGIATFPILLLTAGRAEGEPVYLIDRMSIQIAPSLSEIGIGAGLHRNRDTALAVLTAEARATTLARSLVVGDPTFDDAQYDMPQLPGAAAEAGAVAETFGAQALVGQDATLAAVRARLRASPGPVYLHFATHGLADREELQNNQSFVALASGDRLTLADVARLGIADGSVVVLSACQTGLGVTRAGGVVGLPRAFQNAGAQTVIMSLWNVDDGATRFLMVQFAEQLEQSGRPASAFAAAVRATRAEYPDPRLWASFEVFGTARP